MNHHFFAFMARMKLIRRWGLMRNTHDENIQEHSLQVAMIAHALATIRNVRYGGNVDVAKVMELATYHEAAEVITGDLVTPVKYFNPEIREEYGKIERLVSEQLLTYLPEDLRDHFRPVLFPDTQSEAWTLVKAADKISAYLKCLEENSAHNKEFERAEENLKKSVFSIDLPEVQDFLREFVPSFSLTLDGLN